MTVMTETSRADETSTSQSETASIPCASCGNPGKLQCPKCLELQLPKPASVFCSQDCFKKAWAGHKECHKLTNAWMYVTNRGQKRSPKMPYCDWTGPLRPELVGPTRKVPDSIPRPDYANDGTPRSEIESRQQRTVPIRSAKEIAGMRVACRLAREVLDKAHAAVRPGVTTDEIDRIVHEATVEAGAYPSPLNYYNFPKSVCTSVNEVICHGIPDKRPLQDGDIVNVDVTAYYKGYHGDLNETYVVGQVDDASKKLIRCAYDCLHKAMAEVKPGVRFREIGNFVSQHAQQQGFSVVRTFCGHGISDLFHCAPNIPHYSHNKVNGIMREGMLFTIEPMINAGGWKDITWPDEWTAVTRDGQRSAQFEHTLLVTADGCEALTKRLPTSPPLWWEAEQQA
ncbi:Microtubule-associated protein 1A [Trebouxia sp. C0009 RCD-2024]